ncbi:hypothetical protein KAOT1_00950 [Kordia algicida OT-1]|uniref:Uncharacterized protein n=1 Tax=Kordia algicida OT-1 TaxID=391587 RepID=A9EDR6_9FLAO|nr:hypothetical protein KAOT1_00950 [Kordia algicida OT-1]
MSNKKNKFQATIYGNNNLTSVLDKIEK